MSTFYQSFRLLMNDIGYFYVVFSRFIKGGRYHFCVHRTCHISHLLWALVNEQYNHIYLWVVLSDGIGYLLE